MEAWCQQGKLTKQWTYQISGNKKFTKNSIAYAQNYFLVIDDNGNGYMFRYDGTTPQTIAPTESAQPPGMYIGIALGAALLIALGVYIGFRIRRWRKDRIAREIQKNFEQKQKEKEFEMRKNDKENQKVENLFKDDSNRDYGEKLKSGNYISKDDSKKPYTNQKNIQNKGGYKNRDIEQGLSPQSTRKYNSMIQNCKQELVTNKSKLSKKRSPKSQQWQKQSRINLSSVDVINPSDPKQKKEPPHFEGNSNAPNSAVKNSKASSEQQQIQDGSEKGSVYLEAKSNENVSLKEMSQSNLNDDVLTDRQSPRSFQSNSKARGIVQQKAQSPQQNPAAKQRQQSSNMDNQDPQILIQLDQKKKKQLNSIPKKNESDDEKEYSSDFSNQTPPRAKSQKQKNNSQQNQGNQNQRNQNQGNQHQSRSYASSCNSQETFSYNDNSQNSSLNNSRHSSTKTTPENKIPKGKSSKSQQRRDKNIDVQQLDHSGHNYQDSSNRSLNVNKQGDNKQKSDQQQGSDSENENTKQQQEQQKSAIVSNNQQNKPQEFKDDFKFRSHAQKENQASKDSGGGSAQFQQKLQELQQLHNQKQYQQNRRSSSSVGLYENRNSQQPSSRDIQQQYSQQRRPSAFNEYHRPTSNQHSSPLNSYQREQPFYFHPHQQSLGQRSLSQQYTSTQYSQFRQPQHSIQAQQYGQGQQQYGQNQMPTGHNYSGPLRVASPQQSRSYSGPLRVMSPQDTQNSYLSYNNNGYYQPSVGYNANYQQDSREDYRNFIQQPRFYLDQVAQQMHQDRRQYQQPYAHPIYQSYSSNDPKRYSNMYYI